MAKFTNADQLAAGLSTLFMQEFNNYNNDSEDVAMFNRVFKSYTDIKNKTTNFGMLGNVPKMREWKGGREAGDINKYSYNVTQVKYEGTLRFDRDELELYDEYGQVNSKITELAQEAAQHKVRLGTEFLEGSIVGNLCYDGQTMCDNAHSEGLSGTQDNLGTDALASASFAAARLAMLGYKDDKARITPNKPDLLIVPGALFETASHIMNDDYFPHVSTTPSNVNVWKGAADVWDNPYLSSAVDWWLAASKSGLPPMFIAMARNYEFTYLTDQNAKHEGVYEYGVQASMVFGNANWRKLYGNDV